MEQSLGELEQNITCSEKFIGELEQNIACSEKSYKELSKLFYNLFDIDALPAREYSPLVLAYIGDAIYDLVIRSYVVALGNAPVDKLHNRTAAMVKAETQAKLITAIKEELSEEEWTIYKRGRNANSYSMAKNARMSDYRKATGCEALMGYLYLEGRIDRMLGLIQLGLSRLELV